MLDSGLVAIFYFMSAYGRESAGLHLLTPGG